MHSLPDRISPNALGRLQLRMRRMLRPTGALHQAVQGQEDRDAGRYRPLQWRAEPRRHTRLREAEIGETALSICEIAHGRHIGEIQ